MRYVVHPGFVRSRTDGQLHYVSADRLRQLYHLPRTAHVITFGPHGYRQTILPDDVHLYPREDGNYDLKEAPP